VDRSSFAGVKTTATRTQKKWPFVDCATYGSEERLPPHTLRADIDCLESGWLLDRLLNSS
jgi:hypothetical protein